ncbi:hypothetical protein Cni_G08306 [Canna indica]|uniref:BZIP domain-containing protein n=1 Tax=Canna indica TaxID=4628 RepID=A0AAQ3Q8I1_9LILI|nr:hypothetical protein Cni_G08306 [Canna indica]
MLSLGDNSLDLIGPPWADQEPDAAAISQEEVRRLRRLISNRESARRCRLRKQRRLEELRARVGRLRANNSDLADQLGRLARQCLFVRRNNDHLRAEASALWRRLDDLRRRMLSLRQLHHFVAPPPPFAACDYEQAWASLIA